MNKDALLRLKDVTKYYGHKLIFRHLNLQVNPGEGMLILGANGAGKSTLLRIMAGLASPGQGSSHQKDGLKIAFLAHAPLLYPGLTAMENLRFWASAAKADASAEKLTAILTDMNLMAHAHEPAGVFSRGMAQRLNFARVFLQKADLLLLDEPLTGLDSHSRNIIHEHLRECRQKGVSIVMVSHSPQSDSWLADRVVLLGGRKLLFSGTWPEYAAFHRENAEAGAC